MQNNKHWYQKTDQDGIIWLHFDQAKTSTNVLTVEALEALNDQLAEIEQQNPTGLIICSDKSNGFIAGADVKAFSRMTDKEEAAKQIRQAHAIFARLENLSFPTVALIHGFCFGGGTELALACRYRVCRNDTATLIGLPEVRLGIFPGFGGTVRSTWVWWNGTQYPPDRTPSCAQYYAERTCPEWLRSTPNGTCRYVCT